MLTLKNEVIQANFEYKLEENSIYKLIGNYETNGNNELIQVNGQFIMNDNYIGNVFINIVDNKLKVNISNIDFDYLAEVNYLAQELVKEFKQEE